jgi:hypothetical protein
MEARRGTFPMPVQYVPTVQDVILDARKQTLGERTRHRVNHMNLLNARDAAVIYAETLLSKLQKKPPEKARTANQ